MQYQPKQQIKTEIMYHGGGQGMGDVSSPFKDLNIIKVMTLLIYPLGPPETI
jgi:hypothetical protein